MDLPKHLHRALFLTWLLAGLVSAGACNKRHEDPPESTYAIQGSVRDDLSGAAINGAQLTFVSDTADKTVSQSDGDGHYSMVVRIVEGVRFGTLHTSASGYADSASQTVYFDGTSRTVDLRMRARAPAK